MNIDQSYIRAFVGQTIHRNGLWLYERVAEDVPDASFMYAKLEEKNIMSISYEDGFQVVESRDWGIKPRC